MATLPLEVSPKMEQEYLALPEAARRRLDLEIVFRLGQLSDRSNRGESLRETLRNSRAEARKNGITEDAINELLKEVGHTD